MNKYLFISNCIKSLKENSILIYILIVLKKIIPFLHEGIIYASHAHLFCAVTFEQSYQWLYVCSCGSEKASKEMSNVLLLPSPAQKWRIPLGIFWNVTVGWGELCMSPWQSHIKQSREVKMIQKSCFVASGQTIPIFAYISG